MTYADKKTMTRRWHKAQRAEAKIWHNHPDISEATGNLHKQHLNRMCQFTSLSEEELKQMSILEIGGPVVEDAFDDINIPLKISLDPLFPFSRLHLQDHPCQRVKGIGEYLPLRDRSIDLCWCANTIDHTLSPLSVLKEIRRVLIEQGTLIISCNVFATWTKPAFPVFNALDSPHPHHFTLTDIRSLIKSEFEIQQEWEMKTDHWLSLAQNLKENFARLVGIRYLYWRCTPIIT